MAGEESTVSQAAPLLGAFGPWGAAIGLAGSIGAGLYGSSQAKKAKKRAKARLAKAEGLIRRSGETAKADIGIREGKYRAGVRDDQLRRGLTGTSALDAAMNESMDRENRSGAMIDERTASQLAGLLGESSDIYDGRAVSSSLASLGSGLANLVTGLGRSGGGSGESADLAEQSPLRQAMQAGKGPSGAPLTLPGGGTNLTEDAFSPDGTGEAFGTPGWSSYSDALQPRRPRRRRSPTEDLYSNVTDDTYDFAAGMP